tara:strand:- start:526 stop:684 length:159 start_codon:yes stop_codon:yes gene_type:complete
MRQWLYKVGKEPKIFEGNKIEEATRNGWVDTPAKFETLKTVKKAVKKPIKED